MGFTQVTREAEIKTPLGADVFLLQDMQVVEELGRLFSIELTLLSEQEDIKFEDLLAKQVTVRLDIKNDGKRFYNGYVTHFSQSVNSGSFAVYTATVKPWLWFLTRTSDCRIFQEQTVPDIIKAVFRDLGFTDFEDKLSASYRTWEYCVQYRETDFNFVSRLMEQEGIYYYFKHEDGKHTLVLADSINAHDPIPLYDTIPYHQANDAYVGKEEHISSWLVSKQIQPGVFAQDDFDFKRPKAVLDTDSSIIRSHDKADYEIYDYPGEYVETGDGNTYARTRIEAVQSQYEQVHAGSGARGMMSGGLFTLKDYPREDQNREYLVVSTSQQLYNDGYESQESNGGTTYSNTFSVIESTTVFRPQRSTFKPMVQGPQTAIVVGPSGEEIYTDEYGRVKLQFHWDRYGKSDENSSCWVRVSQIWAGKNWGGIHLPRIGQEVIVEFLEGDPDRPIVTGRVYNGDQVPPYDLPANKTQSGIKSRSSKGGSGSNFNEIRFEDKMGKEQVYIHAEKNQRNIVENNETTSIGHDRTEVVGHDETIDIGNDRTETVANNEDITIGVNRTEAVGANEDIIIGASRSKTVGAGDSLQVGASQTTTIAASQTNTIGANQTDIVGGTYSQTAAGGINITTPAAMTLTALGGYTLVAPGGTKVIDNFFTKLGGTLTQTYGNIYQYTPVKVEGTGVAQEFKILTNSAEDMTVKVGNLDVSAVNVQMAVVGFSMSQAIIEVSSDALHIIK